MVMNHHAASSTVWPDGQQAMVAQDGCLPVAQGFGDAFAFGSFVNNAGEVSEQGVVIVEGAYVLGNWIQQAAE